jgi:hypothetical protein
MSRLFKIYQFANFSRELLIKKVLNTETIEFFKFTCPRREGHHAKSLGGCKAERRLNSLRQGRGAKNGDPIGPESSVVQETSR